MCLLCISQFDRIKCIAFVFTNRFIVEFLADDYLEHSFKRFTICTIYSWRRHISEGIVVLNASLSVPFTADTHEKADTLCVYFDDPTMFAPEKITKGYEFLQSKTNDIHLFHVVCMINSAKGLEIKTFDFK